MEFEQISTLPSFDREPFTNLTRPSSHVANATYKSKLVIDSNGISLLIIHGEKLRELERERERERERAHTFRKLSSYYQHYDQYNSTVFRHLASV